MGKSDQMLVKTSAVRVAAGEADRIYASLADVPPEIREQLRKAIEGPDSETILIADEAGREKLREIIRRLPPETQERVLATIRGLVPHRTPDRPRPKLSLAVRAILVLASLAIIVAWLVWLWRR